ncbi:hypothetical protein AMJ49_04675 [Parcubacteria bacterium DG_74_2]|nr:MAG: hypothetical protein AMJ49_04675 [Parcubacteria bacterium DG_74_2]
MIYNSQHGISLYLVVLFMSIVLAMVLGLSTILIGELKITKGLGDSVIAFYAADTGIERILIDRAGPSCPSGIPETSLGEAKYEVIVTPAGGGCNADNCCIKSLGTYNETKRAIEIMY